MKKALGFAIVWTIFATVGTVAIWNDASWAEEASRVRLLLSTLPFFGLFFIWWSWQRFKRYRSVRIIDGETEKHFVWTDLDGKERKSATDPRIRWDEVDRLDDK